MCHGFMTHPLFFFMDFFHRISRMNRKAFLLIGLLTEFRRILAAGQWAHARYVLLLFLVPQISQMCTDFSSWDYFCPTDFTDLHRFFSSEGFSSDFTDESEAVLLIGLLTDFRGYLAAGQWLTPYICSCCFFVTQISQMTQIFLRGIILSHRFRFTQIFLENSSEIFLIA